MPSTDFLINIRAKLDGLSGADSALKSVSNKLQQAGKAADDAEKRLAKMRDPKGRFLKKGSDAYNAAKAALASGASLPTDGAADKAKTPLDKLIGKKAAVKDVLGGQIGSLASAAQEAGGPIGELASKATNLSSIMGKAGAAGAVLILAATFYKLAEAAAHATYEFLKFALVSADAARSAHLLEVAAGGDAIRGNELSTVVSQLARKVPILRDRLSEMAQKLVDSKLAGLDMQNALTGIAIVASARGEQAAGAIENIAKQSAALRRFTLGARDMRGEFASLAGTGIKAKDVYKAVSETMGISLAAAQAKVLSGTISLKQGMEILSRVAKDKFGTTVGAQMLSLTSQAQKTRENIGLLFSGVNIDKFLVGLSSVTALFSQDTATGYILKKVLSDSLTGFFDVASKVFPYVRTGILVAAIAGLKLYLTFILFEKKLSSIGEKFGLLDPDNKLGQIDVMGSIATMALAMVDSQITQMIATLDLVLAPIEQLANAFDYVSKINLSDAGSKIIDSLISGIKSKASALASAVADVAGMIPKAVAGALDMHSPSRIGVAQGGNWTLSQAKGVRSKADELESAAEDASMAMVRGGGKAGVSGSVGGPGVTIEQLHFHVMDSELVPKIRETLFAITREAKLGVA